MIYIQMYIFHLFHYSLVHYHTVLVSLLFHFHMNLDILTNPLDSYHTSLIYRISRFHTLEYNLSSPPYNYYNLLTYLRFHLHILVPLVLAYNYLINPLDMSYMSLELLSLNFHNNLKHPVDRSNKFLMLLFFHFHS